jgi:rSAM/selenodomain-associated transferase 1
LLDSALIVFARAPRPGSVKTRLIEGGFTAEEACEIHLALLGDVLEQAARAARGTAALSLAWSEPPATPPAPDLIPAGVTVETQAGSDLGERMARAIQEKLRAGHRKALILGSDAPTLPADHLRAAFDALAAREIVIGPADDGGYYLIGMSRLHLEIFRDVPWGSRNVLSVTRKRLAKAGTPHQEIGPWHDVDTAEDLKRLWKEILHLKERKAPEIPRRTFGLLARLGPARLGASPSHGPR